LKLDTDAIAQRVLFFCIGMSILSMPLAIVQKVSVAGAEFSVSYLFIAAVIAWVFMRAILRLPRGGGISIPAVACMPLIMVALTVFYGGANGFDPRFMQAVLFWAIFTFLGMLMPEVYHARFCRLMSWLGVVTAVLGLVLYAINIPLIDLEAAGSDQYFVDGFGHYRASSVFLNPNSFGYFLLFYFCVRMFGNRPPGRFISVGFLCVLSAFLLSGSRSALVAFAFLFVMRVVIAMAPQNRFPLMLGINTALLAVLALLIVLSDKFIGQDIRFEKWSFSLELFLQQAQRIYFGMPEYIPLEKLGVFFSDNMFLTFLFKFGIVGFLVFAVYYLVIVYRAVSALVQESPALRPFAAYVLASSVLFFYSTFLSFYPMVLMHGVAVGVLLARRPLPLSPSSQVFETV
jgi:O-antigen ligase